MAPMGESVYFPPLDKCLDGGSQLFSWKTVFTGLSQISETAGHRNLRRHLTDAHTTDFLIQPFQPFASPTPQTRAAFETKTSAANVTPSAHGRYDIRQIKDDAVWLSKETAIDEISSLRIVVVEWQMRAANQLLQGYSEVEAATQQGVPMGRGLGSSFLGSASSTMTAVQSLKSSDDGTFDSARSRRLRLLDLYLSERRYVLKTCEYIIFSVLCKSALNDEGSYDEAEHESLNTPIWVEQVGNKILTSWNLQGVMKASNKNFIVDAIEAIVSRVGGLERGSEWLKDEGSHEELEVAWSRNQILETVHIMQIILVVIESSPKLMRSDTITSWFRLMSRYSYFEQFLPPYQSLIGVYDLPLQSLVALVSLAVFKLPIALEALDHLSGLTASAAEYSESGSFLLNPASIHEINGLLMETATACISNASPAFFAWGIIMQTLRDHALKSKELRENRQSQRAVDNYGAADSSDNDGSEEQSGRRRPSPRRRSSIGSDTSQQPTFLEEILDRIMDTPLDQDPIGFLARTALDKTHVFDLITSLAVNFCTQYGTEHHGKAGMKIRLILLDLIKAAIQWLDYQPDMVLATLAVLTGDERHWEISERPLQLADAEPAAVFLNDELLMQRIFLIALSRFPYESLPFLKVCRALAVCRSVPDEEKSSLELMLGSIGSFTCTLSEAIADYSLFESTDDGIQVKLRSSLDWFGVSEDLSLKASRKPSSRDIVRSSRKSESFQIPKDTLGRVLTNGKPLIVMWNYTYSGLKFFGIMLQCTLNGNGFSSDTDPTGAREVVSEIIGLITSMLTSASKNPNHDLPSLGPRDAAQMILEELSDGLDRNQDIISVIFTIFEDELHKDQALGNDDDSMDILIRCIQFIYALLPILPGRVWPFLARSGLLGVDGKESRLAAVVANGEVASGHFDFLLGCIRVFDELVEDTIIHAIPRRGHAKATTRFSSPDITGTGISDSAMKKVLLCMERIMIDIFESVPNWRFASQVERFEINTRICTIFQQILHYCFTVDDTLDTSSKLTGLLCPAADYLVDVFLSRSANDLLVQPLLNIFREGVATPHSTLPTRGLQYWSSQIIAALNLSTTLVRLNRLLGSLPARLEEQLFKSISVLATLYAAHEGYRLPIVELFEALVRSANSTDVQPPSLLGHMGQGTARHFLDLLSMLDAPLDDDNLSTSIWRLLSAIVSQRQQWFAIFIFTGSTPRDSLRTKQSSNSGSHRDRPMLNHALECLSNIERLRPETSTSILQFVALAADFWPWVMTDIGKDSAFMTAVTEFIAQTKSNSTMNGSKVTSVDYRRIQNASLMTDILAMYVHYNHQLNDKLQTKKLLPKLAYLVQNAVAVPSYNSSLHRNLRKNFEAKYPGCSLMSFKKTTLKRPQLGASFFYDTELARKLLMYDPAWSGTKNQGFADELFRANTNLSLVEAQINLFHSWKFLVVELGLALRTDEEFQKSLEVTIRGCLISNAENNMPEALFDRLARSRADLAFTLLQQVIEAAPSSPGARSILIPAWDLVRGQVTNLGMLLVGDDAAYHRTLLKILCLALQAHVPPLSESDTLKASAISVTPEESPSNIIRIVLEILGVIVAQGFRSLTTILHDDPLRVVPADFTLITAILRTCFCIPGVDRHAAQLVSQFTDDSTARYACTLLSWSDHLAIDRDPVYGELSVQFLVELSNKSALAESLAVEGVLTHISTTNLMNYFRRPQGIGPFDEPMRMYDIWSRGILPLLLNMLGSVGAPIAAEVASFLNQFRAQVVRAATSFDGKPTVGHSSPSGSLITLDIASEALSLALLTTILEGFREAGASAGIVASDIVEFGWDKEQVKEDVENWMQRRKALRESIVATNEREEGWSRAKPLSSHHGAESRLEEKIISELNAVLSILGGA